MLPLNSIIKNAFDKFDQDFQTANIPEGKYIQPPPSTVKWYQLGQSCYEDKIQELNTDFAKICISPKSSGLLWSKFLKNWNIRQDRIFPLSISLLPLPRLPLSVMSLWKSTTCLSTPCPIFSRENYTQWAILACLGSKPK